MSKIVLYLHPKLKYMINYCTIPVAVPSKNYTLQQILHLCTHALNAAKMFEESLWLREKVSTVRNFAEGLNLMRKYCSIVW